MKTQQRSILRTGVVRFVTGFLLATIAACGVALTGAARAADNVGTGGTITYTDASGLNPQGTPIVGGYVVHKFTAGATLVLPAAAAADYLIVGGGGGGGRSYGAGGGAGGMLTGSGSIAQGSYPIVVGTGGAGAAVNGAGTTGNDSTFSGLTAKGGGGGGSSGVAGKIGGSGGGGGSSYGSGTAGQGNNGGSSNTYGGGGGGAGGAGANGSSGSSTAGVGGAARASSISGTATYYAQGGCAFAAVNSPNYGGGNSGATGTANTGGGGGAWNGTSVGAGGSGIVIVRYPYASADPGVPTVARLSPPDNATDVGLNKNLVIDFDRLIAIGTGNITLKNLTDNTQTTIDITDSGQVSVSGPTLTINPTADLAEGKGYAVRIDATAIKDASGGFSFAGISDDTTWDFTSLNRFIEFTTDPALSTLWTRYSYYGTAPVGAAVWNSTDHDLDLTKDATSDWILGLYRTDFSRSASEPVSMTVKALGRPLPGWGFVGLMITAVPQQNYLVGAGDSYTFAMVPVDATTFKYEVRRTYADGTANYQLYTGSTIAFAGPYTLSIVRNGDHYQFIANGTTLYTTTGVSPDFYNAASKDSMVYYQVVFGGNGAMTATVDDFGIDTTAPAIATLNPADDATGVAVGANLVATFTEGIRKGTGNITLKKSDGSTVETFDVTSSAQLVWSGSTVTIDPASALDGLTDYYVQIDSGAIRDWAGNSFAGIADSTTWNFTSTTTDTSPPQLSGLSPADDATGVEANANLVATFNENVRKGTGNITLKKSSDNSTVETFDVASSARVTVIGATVTIDPTSSLALAAGYYLLIDNNTIQDASGNPFAGIATSTEWTFTTFVPYWDFSTDPGLGTLWTPYTYYQDGAIPPPADAATWNATDKDLDLAKASGIWIMGLYRTGCLRSATEPVSLTVKALSQTSPGWGFLGLMVTAVQQQNYLSGAGDSYTFAMVPLSATTFRYEIRRTYADGGATFQLYTGSTITFAGPYTLNVVRYGDHYQFIANGTTLYTTTGVSPDFYNTASKDSMVYFEVVFGGQANMTATVDDFGVDTTPPAIATLSPADDAGGVAVSANLVATFSEVIQKGTGNVTLKQSSDNSIVETFDVASSPRVVVSGATVTIDPTSDLAPDTGYYVLIDISAIKDSVGNSFAGLSGATDWNFTSEATPGVAAPAFALPAGGYLGAQSVTISCATPGATIHYTTNGDDPTTGSPVYSGAIAVPVNTTVIIKALAVKAGYTDSGIASATYVTSDSGTWTNPAGGSWATTGNWLNGVVAQGSDVPALFNTLTLGANATVTLDGPRTVGSLAFADVGNGYDWTISTSGPLTLDATGTPEIGVANRTTTISAVVAGTKGLAKTGAGVLTVSGNNNYAGSTTVNGGTIKIGHAAALGASDTAVTKVIVASGGAVDFNGVPNAMYGYTIGGVGPDGNGALVNNGVTINNANAQTSNIKLSGNATIGGLGDWALLASLFNANSLDLSGFTLTKAGANMVTLCNTTVSDGNITVTGGTLNLYAGSLNQRGTYIQGSGTITIGDGSGNGTFQLADTYQSAGKITRPIALSGGRILTLAASAVIDAPIYVQPSTTSIVNNGSGGNLTLQTGAVTGSGTITVGSINSSGSVYLSGDCSGFAGVINFVDISTGTNLRLLGSASNFSGATFSLSGDVVTSGRMIIWDGTGGATLQMGALSGTGGVIGGGASFGGNAFTLQVGALGRDTAFGGIIQNSGSNAVGLSKVGNGTQMLSGANTYSGGTTIFAGTLLVNNATGSGTGTGPVSVQANGTLGGNGAGRISGLVTVTSGGTLSPGSSGVGTLLATQLTVEENAALAWDAQSGSADIVAVSGALTLPSQMAVRVNRLSPSELGGAVLFTYGSYSGPEAIALTVTGATGTILAKNDAANHRIVLEVVTQGTVFSVR